MSETIEGLTIAYSENGIETTKELDKCILSKGAWVTILFRYQDFDHKKQMLGPVKYSIRRYQKRDNQYRLKSKFNISSEKQAQQIISTLNEWLSVSSQ